MRKDHINICFTKNDKDLITWANMIKDSNQSIGTWVQALLIAEDLNLELDTGSVTKHPDKKSTSSPLLLEISEKTSSNQISGWNVRGSQGEIIVGSIITISITRPAMAILLQKLKRNHKRVGPYIKAILRKRIQTTQNTPNRPPEKNTLRDFFALYEYKYIENQNNGRNKRKHENQDHQKPHQKIRSNRVPKQIEKKKLEQEPENTESLPTPNAEPMQKPITKPKSKHNSEPKSESVPIPKETVRPPVVKGKKLNPLLGYID